MSSHAGAWVPKSPALWGVDEYPVKNGLSSQVSRKHRVDKDVVASLLEWGAYWKPIYFQGWGLVSLVIFVNFQSLANFFRVLWASWDTLLLSEGKEYRGSRYTQGPNRLPNVFWHRSPIFISNGATFQGMKFGEHCCRWMLTFCLERGNAYAKNQTVISLFSDLFLQTLMPVTWWE